MSQISFSDAEYAGKRKKTGREVFLNEMKVVVPARRPPGTPGLARPYAADPGGNGLRGAAEFTRRLFGRSACARQLQHLLAKQRWPRKFRHPDKWRLCFITAGQRPEKAARP